ncbi:MAG: cellulose biosynthesis protein BcsG, partial [Legionellales bacterium]
MPTNTESRPLQPMPPTGVLKWPGLGLWNYYFLLKFCLLWFGYLNFHATENLVFLCFLVVPLPARWLNRCRNW